MATPPMTPPGGGGDDQAPLANVALEASIKMRDTLKEVRDILGSLPKVAEDVGKKFTKATTEMKGLVLLADSAQDAFKGIADYSKGLTKTLAADKSLKNMKATLEALKKSAQQAKVLADPAGMKVLDRTIAGVNKRLETMSTLSEEAFDDEKHAAYIGFLKTTNKELEKMGTLAGRAKVRFEGTMSVRKNLIEAGIIKGGRTEKYAKYGEAAVKLKEAAAAKKGEFETRRKAADQSVRQIFGLDPDTKIDWAKVARQKRGLAKTLPAGQQEDALKALSEGAATARPGLMGKLTQTGMVESGVGSVASLVGQAAIPLAIAEAVKDLVVAIIDKNAAMNKQAETLAGGGILLGSGVSGADALLAARQNLQPSGIMGMNQLGLTIDRSVKMAQTIMESGYAIEELAGGGTKGFGRDRGDFGPGTFGQVQELAATTGRVLGMGDAQSVELTMKLLMQYRESMEGTQSFFTNMTKDTRAAGLSTTKYISILDEVLGHFDRMNKSLDQVTGTMRGLSRTGRMTAEDLQATLGLITGAGRQPMDLGAQAFTAIQMKRGPGLAQMEKSGKENVEANAANISQSLQKIGLNFDQATVSKYLNQPDGHGADALRAAVDQAQAGGKYDSKAIINAQATINKGASAAMGLRYTQQFKAGTLSPLDYAAAMTGKGMDEQETANFRRTAMQTMMGISGFSQKDIVSGKAVSPEMLLMLQKAIPGFKEEDITNMRQTLQTGAKARMMVTAEGTTPADEKKAEILGKELAKNIPEFGKFSMDLKPKDQGSWIRLFKRWQNDGSNPEAHGRVLTYLEEQTSTMNDVYNANSDIAKGMTDEQKQKAKDDAVDKAKSVGRVTQDTATIFATVFSSFFNDIISGIEAIRVLIVKLAHPLGIGEDTAAQQANDPRNQRNIQTAIDANNLTIGQLKDALLDTTKSDKEKSDLMSRLKTAEKFKKEFEQEYGPGSGLGTDQFNQEMEDVKKAILSLNDPVTNLMDHIGGKFEQDKKTHEYEYTLNQKQVNDNAAALSQLVDSGAAKVTEEKTSTGDTIYHYQTTHYYDANYVQVTSGDQSPTTSPDGAAATPPPIRPRGIRR